MQSDSGKINNGITCVIITNHQISEIKSLKTILEITDKVIIVTNRRENPSTSNSIRIIYSSSQNYAYLRNLGAYCAETTHILVIDSDEILDDTFLKEVKQISYEAKMYCVNIKTFVGVKEVSMAQRYNPRIYDNREFVYIGRVHEALTGNRNDCIKLKGSIFNFSQENWKGWYEKAKRYTSQERIEGRLILRSIYPFFNFFKMEGWRDGLTGMKWTLKAFQYMAMVFLYGKRGHVTLKPEEVKQLILTETVSKEEREYISAVLSKYFRSPGEQHSSEKDIISLDMLEQISSPFVRYY
ncbi:MAG: hypothetical protein RE469_09540 [Cuniculiplasma divulgatum]|nr:MAG: hypothetical protein RE469_09540 [Cuniculiplasma divulgatum]